MAARRTTSGAHEHTSGSSGGSWSFEPAQYQIKIMGLFWSLVRAVGWGAAFGLIYAPFAILGASFDPFKENIVYLLLAVPFGMFGVFKFIPSPKVSNSENDFWKKVSRIFIGTVKFISWGGSLGFVIVPLEIYGITCLMGKIDPPKIHVYLLFICGGVFLLYFFWHFTIKPIRARIKNNFYVRVTLYPDDPNKGRVGIIETKDRWGGDNGKEPEGDKEQKIGSVITAAALQNVLHRLCDLQNSAMGGRGMLQVKELEGSERSGWKFTCRYDPFVSLLMDGFRILLAVGTLGAFAFLLLTKVGVFQNVALLPILSMAVLSGIIAFVLHRRMSVTNSLYLTIEMHQQTNDIADLSWSELCQFGVIRKPIHKHSIVLTNVDDVAKFCEKVTRLQNVIRDGDITHGELGAQANYSSHSRSLFRTWQQKIPRSTRTSDYSWRIRYSDA